MLKLTFSSALPLFTAVLTLVYTIMLLLADKHSNTFTNVNSRASASKYLALISFILSSIGFTFTTLFNFRETLPYYLILVASLTMNIIAVLYRPIGISLASFVLWHLTVIWDKAPDTGIAIGEGAQMIREMALNDHWHFEWAHNPSYNPLPTIAFIQATLSRITTITWYNWYLGSALFIAWAVAYDLALYMLTYILTKDKRVAMLAVPLIAITPETAIHQHPYQWSGNMLTLLATAILIKLIVSDSRPSNLVVVILCFVGAILAHLTGLSFLFILISIPLARYIVPLLMRILKIRNADLVRFSNAVSEILATILVSVFVVLFIRIIYTYGCVEYVLPTLEGVICGFIDFLREFFVPTSKEIGVTYHVPLYERAGVSFIQAYVWSFAIALATAYILYSMIKKHINVLYFSLYIAVTFILVIAFICYALIRKSEFYVLNRTTYVLIPLLFPLAALSIRKTLSPLFSKSLCTIAIVSLILLTFTAPIAARDPNISPIRYAEVRGIPIIETTSADISKASVFLNLVDYSYIELGKKTVYVCSSENYVKKVVYTQRGCITELVLTNVLSEAITIYEFINRLPRISTTALPMDNVTDLVKVLDFGRDSIALSLEGSTHG